MGAVSTRSIDGDVEPKRVMHHKFNNESVLQSSDVQVFRYIQIFFFFGITMPLFTFAHEILILVY